jgi:hypothetical protein
VAKASVRGSVTERSSTRVVSFHYVLARASVSLVRFALVIVYVIATFGDCAAENLAPRSSPDTTRSRRGQIADVRGSTHSTGDGEESSRRSSSLRAKIPSRRHRVSSTSSLKATIPFGFEDARSFVPITTADAVVRGFTLDSGAQPTLLDAGTASTLNLSLRDDGIRSERVEGIPVCRRPMT